MVRIICDVYNPQTERKIKESSQLQLQLLLLLLLFSLLQSVKITGNDITAWRSNCRPTWTSLVWPIDVSSISRVPILLLCFVDAKLYLLRRASKLQRQTRSPVLTSDNIVVTIWSWQIPFNFAKGNLW